jgi:RHS repeat-associated protein
VNANNNRVQSWTYDSNGNATNIPGVGFISYDAANRVKTVGSETYEYAPSNKRIWKNNGFTLWGASGERIGDYTVAVIGGQLRFSATANDAYFGGKRLQVTDRLGSVRSESGVARSYFPYGEERTSTPNPGDKFGTYRRDGTGLDYADQRYFVSATGRFSSPDPFQGSASPSNPGSWNRYSYSNEDPVNLFDPNGLSGCPVATTTSYLYNGIVHSTTTMHVCDSSNFDVLGYIRVYGNASMGITGTSYHWNGAQDIYESGNCATADGRNCAEEDLLRRFFAQFTPEPCTLAQHLNTPQDCDGGAVALAATPAFTLVRGALIRGGMSVLAAHMAAVQIVGTAAALYVSRLTGLPLNNLASSGQQQLRWVSGSSVGFRIPDIVDFANKIAIEVKYVSDFRVTAQILDTARLAMQNGWTYRIYLYHGATMSPQSQATLAGLGVQVHRF